MTLTPPEPPFPAEWGYYMPAEWEPHHATWLTWPHNPETWPGVDLAEIESAYVRMIGALCGGERVCILVNEPETSRKVAAQLLANNLSLENIDLHVVPTNDSWIRDYGPNFLINPNSPDPVAFNKWGFDSWGGKYEYGLDNRVGYVLKDRLGFPAFDPGIVLEGGAIEVNGKGTCLVTEECLLNKNRNGGLSREVMEQYLKNYLGVRRIIWLHGELAGDDTDGHIDNLARFVNPDAILCARQEDPADPDYPCLEENFRILQSARDQEGNPFDVVPLPMPKVEDRGERLPASHANFYIGNEAVLLPVYGGDSDAKAAALLEKFFPDRKVERIDCRSLIWGLGAVHCLTQQQPTGK